MTRSSSLSSAKNSGDGEINGHHFSHRRFRNSHAFVRSIKHPLLTCSRELLFPLTPERDCFL